MVKEGFTAFHPRGTRLSACLKMAGDPPAAQIGKDARACKKGQRDGRDLMRPRSQSAGNKGRAFLQSCGRAALFLRSTFSLKTGVKRPWLWPCHRFHGGVGAMQAPTSVKASQEARSVCLGRNEPRFPWRLCGKPSWQSCGVGVITPCKLSLKLIHYE